MIKTALVCVLMCCLFFGGGYYAGMQHYAVAEKDAAIEALARSVRATDLARASHKRANQTISTQLMTERKAWRIYENDTPDRCARTPVNDPRLVELLLDLPERDSGALRLAAGGVPASDPGTRANTGKSVTWSRVGDYAIRLRSAPRQCNADKAAIVRWCELNNCVEADEIGAD